MARQQKLIHLHGSSDFNESVVNIDKGELAVEHGTGAANVKLWTLDETGAKVAFVTGAKVADDIATAKSGAETTAKAYTDAREGVLQGQIDALSNKVGTTDVAAQIEAAVKVEADRAKLAEQANAAAIDAIEADYLKAADKTELQGYADQAEADAIAAAKEYADGLASNYDVAGSAAQALTDAKEYADGLASNYDAAGSAAQALTDAKAYTDTKNIAMNTRVEALEGDTHTHANKAELDKIADGDKAKWDAASTRIDTFLDGEGIDETLDTLIEIQTWMKGDGVNATELTAAIAAEASTREEEDADIRADFAAADTTTLNLAKADATTKANAAEANAKAYTDAREVEIKKYADDSAADAIAAAKTYTDEVLGGNYTSTNTVTTAFTTAINNAIAGIDLTGNGTGANTGIDVTVNITDGKTMTVTVDDSNLIIDCGTY